MSQASKRIRECPMSLHANRSIDMSGPLRTQTRDPEKLDVLTAMTF